MAIITVGTQKGGVGKTTTAVNLAAALTAGGKRTLLVDLDPQGNATRHVGVEPAGQGLRQALASGGALPITTGEINVVACGDGMKGLAGDLAGQPMANMRLRRCLGATDLSPYDHVIIDTPPTLGLHTELALCASRWVVVPLQLERASADGLIGMWRHIHEYSEAGLNVELLAVVPLFWDGRINQCKDVLEDARQHDALRVTRTVVPRDATVSEAYGAGRPVVSWAHRSKGARAYVELANELQERM